MLPTLRKDLTATAAHPRSAGIRLAVGATGEGCRSDLRAAVPAIYAWQAENSFGGFCRMPSVAPTLDSSKQQEGRP